MELSWAKGLLPAIIQDAETGEVLMLGYMNAESLEKTQETGRVTFYSRSRQRLWTKGETSGNFLDVVEIQPDCDKDALLIRARAHGPTCHRGTRSCFDAAEGAQGVLARLESTIRQRFESADPGASYVARLAHAGIDRMAQKVGEEAVETVIASKNPEVEPFESEAADLLFHLLVLLHARGSSLARVTAILEGRSRDRAGRG